MRKSFVAIVVVLLAWACESKENRIQSFLLKGNVALDEGDDEMALYYYSEALKIDPCFADALNNTGTIHHNASRYEDAIASYTKAVDCNPAFMNAWFNRANTFYESGNYFSAIQDVDHIIKTKPDTSEAYFLRGLVLTKLHKYPDAQTAFQKSLDLGPVNESDCRVNLASVKILLKQYDDAKKELEACIKLNDKEPNIYNSLALIAIEKKDWNEAMKQVNKAIGLSPKQAYFINNRGFINLNLGKIEDAEKDINQSMMLDPYNAWAYRNKGILMLEKKEYSEAQRLLTKAKEMDPEVEGVEEYVGRIPGR